ncbi:hypothetical protein BDW71DRAFT_204741 [Aspergillus fruticulosus]
MDCIKHITARKVLFHGGEPWPGAWQTRTSKSTTLPLEAGCNGSTNGTGHSHGLTYASIDRHPYAETTEFQGWLDRTSPHPNTKTSTTASASVSVNNLSNYAYMESSQDNDADTDTIPQTWDLSGYDAIELVLGKSDGKIYTLALEDDRYFLAWEAQFRCVNEKGLMTATRKIIRFSDLMPQRRRTSTVMSARPRGLDLRKIRRIGIGIYRYSPLLFLSDGLWACVEMCSSERSSVTALCRLEPFR